MIAHDIYAETNPAFCTLILNAFVKAYTSISPSGVEIPSAYIAVPLAMSGDMETTFIGTNKKTGLREWLERNPEVQIELSERLNGTMEFVTEAIRFGCFSGVLQIEQDTKLTLGNQKLAKNVNSHTPDTKGAIKRAERLGYWFATAGSTRNIFNMMELTV